MKTVYLYGRLGERFGKKWHLNVRSTQEAFCALTSNCDGFLEYLIDTEKNGTQYVILNKNPSKIKSESDLKKSFVSEKTFQLIGKNKEIHIIPEIQGGEPITAAFMLVKAFMAKVTIAKIIVAVAVAFVVGAIMKALFKPPERKDPTTTKSYLLQGAKNRQSQGVSVPLGYGRLKIGSTNVSQNKSTKRALNSNNSNSLESFTEIEFLDLLGEGPIEGFVNQNGALLNDSEGIKEGIFLNNVPIANTPQSKDEEPTLNYILNEDGEAPEFQVGEEGSSKIICPSSSFVIDYNVLLYGAGPYNENGNEPRDTTAQYRPTIKGAKENGAKLASHFVSNKNISKITAELNASLAIQNDDGSTSENNVKFAILIEKDHQEKNVLDSGSQCVVTLPRNSSDNLTKVIPETGGDGYFLLKGIATGVYAFDIQIEFKRPNITSKGVTFKFIKLSDEYDPSAKGGAAGGIGRSRDLKLVSVCEHIEEPFLYPHSALCKIKFDSKNFSSLPERSYHVKLKKVLIPSNYDPASRKYNGPWDGLFKGQADSLSSVHSISDRDKFWTDNPAWVFYDLLYNARYGVGRYGLDEDDIDKWQLYKISKYCDELVSTDYPIETSSSLPRSFSTINVVSSESVNNYGYFTINIDSSQLLSENGSLGSYSSGLFEKEFGSGTSFRGKKIAFFIASQTTDISSAPNKTQEIDGLKQKSAKRVGEILIEERFIINSTPNASGGGSLTVSGPSFENLSPSFVDGNNIKTVGACAVQINHTIVEPRFSANLYITDRMEALTLINNMASIFRGIISYSAGKIFALQDSFKNPVQLFNNSNVSPQGFSYSGSSKNQKISTSLVRFNNKDDNFKPDAVYEEDSDAIQKTGFKEKETLGFGITSSSQARRLAKWVLFTSQLEVETVSFSTGQEAGYLFPGAIFEVSDEIRVGKSKSGRVLDVEFYRNIYQTQEVNGQREIISTSSVYEPYILLDKHMLDEPFTSRAELTVCVGLSNSTSEKLNFRAPFEKSSLDQDAEITSTVSPQIMKFDCKIEYDLAINKKGPSGQNVIATDLFFKVPFEISLDDNTFSVLNHDFVNGDRVRFLSEGSLPLGLDVDRKRNTAYYVISCTKHTFKVSLSSSGPEVNVINNGFDFLGNPGGLHYICPEDSQKTKDAIEKIMIGSSWSAKGLMKSKTQEEINQIILNKLSANNVTIGQAENWFQTFLGWVGVYGEWGYSEFLGWIYLAQLEYTTEDDGFWFYLGDAGNKRVNSGWVWTNETYKNSFWFVYSLFEDNNSSTNWVSPIYKNEKLVELFVYDTVSSKSVGDQYYISDNKYVIVEKNSSGYYLGMQGSSKMSDAYRYIFNGSSNTPSSLSGKSFNDRRQDLLDSGFLKQSDILSIHAVSEDQSVQRENSIKIILSQSNNLSIKDSQKVFIEGVVSSDSFDDNINVVYVYDSVDKRWTTTVDPWLLVRINDFEFELKDSSSLYNLFNSASISNSGKVNFIPRPDDASQRNLEGQLFRTMSVKESKDNTYEVVGLEYNSSKFDAVDKQTIVKKPVLPIPPQADMSIPEAPDSLILTDLTR